MTEKDDFILAYKQRLETQYYNKPNANSQIGIHAEIFFELMNFYKKVISELDIDSARGGWLDNIGKIVGFSRLANQVIPKPFFSFKGNFSSLKILGIFFPPINSCPWKVHP